MSTAIEKQIQPADDHILAVPLEKVTKTQGGIFLPDVAQNNKHKLRPWKALAVGPGKVAENGQRLPMPVREGDVFLAMPFTGHQMDAYDMGELYDGEARLMTAPDVKAIVEGAKSSKKKIPGDV